MGSAYVVALDVRGTPLDTDQFAANLQAWGSTGKGSIVFLIGGADGLPPDILSASNFRFSLSKLTMAHRIARVVVAEQLYRAISIWKNEPYHRA